MQQNLPNDITMSVNSQGDDITIPIFFSKVKPLTVSGPQVDTLNDCRRLKCPTFFEKPWVDYQDFKPQLMLAIEKYKKT